MVAGPYPTVVENQQSTRLLVQTSRYGKYLGVLNIDVNSQGQIVNHAGNNPVLLDANVQPGQ